MRSSFLLFIVLLFVVQLKAQNYWQQAVDYTMNIDMDAESNQFEGEQTLIYTNNSPDTLKKVYYHLFFNAFQPNSMMDVRSRTIEDPDRRVGDRIFHLKEDEIGYQKVNKLTQDGKNLDYEVVGTILEVKLDHPILPGKSSTFKMNFSAQVPLQVRRSGRDNEEGIRFSMTQWYPKMAEYDFQGWHAYPYIGREFHGVWGKFDVTINIDADYILGATGYLQNADEVGYGYSNNEVNHEGKEKLSWHFVADSVHDFSWVADPDYTHTQSKLDNGTALHFLFQKDSNTTQWDSLPKYTKRIFEIMNENFGEYPFKQYTVAQGGDGGMEYPMITLITGHRSKGSLVGVTAHEAAHSWYQHILATNEAQHPWMDEGFTSYATDFVMNEIWSSFTPFVRSYGSYFSLVESGKQEPLTTHADHYHTNRAYGVASYSMGLMFLRQLNYIVGEEVLRKSLKRYFHDWKFKHPTPNDFIRVVEKVSNLELSWYLEQWVETTNTIDYGIKSVTPSGKHTLVNLERNGKMPMPLDVLVKYKNGKQEWINIPLRIMRGEKQREEGMENYRVVEDWPWTFPNYELTLEVKFNEIESIQIDPSGRMADVSRVNNQWPIKEEAIFKAK